jgi:hypothetical protein
LIPTLASNPLFGFFHGSRIFSENVKQHDELLAAAVQNSVVRVAVVAAQLSEFASIWLL